MYIIRSIANGGLTGHPGGPKLRCGGIGFSGMPDRYGNKTGRFRVKGVKAPYPRHAVFGENPLHETRMSMKRFTAIGAALLLGLVMHAAEEQNSGESEFSRAQAALKQKAPEAYAKVEKLAATDLDAALREFRKLAREQNVQLPRPQFGGSHGGRGRRMPPDGGRHGRGGSRGGMRGMNPLAALAAENKLREKYPEEFAKFSRERAEAEAGIRGLAAKAHVEYPTDITGKFRALRERAPERFDAILAKSEEDQRGAMMELMNLASEENVDLGFPMMRGDRHMGRMEHRESRPEPRKLNHPPLRKLRENFPEEMKRYEELRREDPKAAEKLLRELAAKLEAKRE